MPNVLLDDPPWPTFFQHLRQSMKSVERCIKSGIALPVDADWIYLGEFKEGVDESLRSPSQIFRHAECDRILAVETAIGSLIALQSMITI